MSDKLALRAASTAAFAALVVLAAAPVIASEVPDPVATSWSAGGEPQAHSSFVLLVTQVVAVLGLLAAATAACAVRVPHRVVTPTLVMLTRTAVPSCVWAGVLISAKNWGAPTWTEASHMGPGSVVLFLTCFFGGLMWGWDGAKRHPAIERWAQSRGVRT